jgi:hypothetical protein
MIQARIAMRSALSDNMTSEETAAVLSLRRRVWLFGCLAGGLQRTTPLKEWERRLTSSLACRSLN